MSNNSFDVRYEIAKERAEIILCSENLMAVFQERRSSGIKGKIPQCEQMFTYALLYAFSFLFKKRKQYSRSM